ncbi:MAG TPA: VanZ family protein [Bacteroidales bacterium]|nr:VanZ family protein [Bacteroidales bacterium]
MLHREYIKPLGLFVAILVLITYGSLGSGEEAAKMNILKFPNSDKVIHGLMYFMLTVSLIYLMVKRYNGFKHWKVYGIVLATPILYGLLMELLQFYLASDRSAELADFIANTSGTILAFVMGLTYYNLHKAY